MTEEIPKYCWVPLVQALEDVDAEIKRGYLEAQGISAQVIVTKRGSAFFRQYYFATFPFWVCDLYVPLDAMEEARVVLDEIENFVDDENFVLVYDSEGELQELNLLPGCNCPACGGDGMEHYVARNNRVAFYLILWVIFRVFSDALALIFFSELSDFWGTIGMLSVICVIFIGSLRLKYQPEKWYCTHCEKQWHK